MHKSILFIIVILNLFATGWIEYQHQTGLSSIEAVYYSGEDAPLGFEEKVKLIPFQEERNIKNPLGKLEYYVLFEYLYLSILIFLGFFTLFQYLYYKDFAYIAYTCFLITFFTHFLIHCNFAFKENTIIHIIYGGFNARSAISWTMVLAYVFYIWCFLEASLTKKSYSLVNYTFIFIGFVFYIIEIYLGFQYGTIPKFIETGTRITCSIYYLFLLYLLVLEFHNPLVKFILVGFVFMISGTLIGQINGVDENFLDISPYARIQLIVLVQIAILFDILLYAIGLGYRSYLIFQEKNITQNKLINVIRKNQELQIKEQEALHLKKLEETKSKFYTNITHEFRTPLTVIKGMSEQIANENIKNLIQRNSQRLLNMVNQLLDLSKLESNKLAVEWVQGDVIAFLNYLTESYHSFASNKNLNLAFFSYETTVEMDFDPEKLQQILSNLISNAIKFTPQYGTIKVITSRFTQNGQDCLKIIIKDTGNGIPQEKLPQIFNRFYQVDDSNTQKGEGSGIGLALVKELVQIMEGQIEVRSELGKGSEFSVYLPIHRNASKQREDQPFSSEPILVTSPTSLIKSETQPSNLNSEKPLILVIEDNADVVEYIITCLQGKYEYQAASNGKIGVSKALEIIPDVILCDVMMPEMDGFEVCEQLKNAKATSHIPIIMLTAKATHEDKIVGLEQGADAYLTKPFDKKELLVRVKNLVILSQKLRESLLSTNFITTKVTETELKQAAFLKELDNIINTNLQKEQFNTQYLCRAIAMSRSQLYRKLKALTNDSTANYIRNFRLKKAKNLLESTDLQIGEIAIQVGFKDFSHFSRSFSKAFGIPPHATRK